MTRNTFTPLRDQEVVMEPRPVSTDQVDAILQSGDPLDRRMDKLGSLRQKHEDWANRQPETDGRPLLHYIDDGILQRTSHGLNEFK